VTLNDLERRNGPYSAIFHQVRVRCRRKKFTFAISSPDEFLVFYSAVGISLGMTNHPHSATLEHCA